MNVEDRLKESLRQAAIGAPVPVQIPGAVARRARTGRLISAVLAMSVAGGGVFGAVAVVRQAGGAALPTAANDISQSLPQDPGVRGSVRIPRTAAMIDVAVGAGAVWVASGALSRYQPGAKAAQTVPLAGPDALDFVNVQGLAASCTVVWAFGRAHERAPLNRTLKGFGGPMGRVKDEGPWLWRVDARTATPIDRIALPDGVTDATIAPDGSLWLVGDLLFTGFRRSGM